MTALQQGYRDAQRVHGNRRGFMVGAAGLTFGFSLGLLETGTRFRTAWRRRRPAMPAPS